MTEQDALEAVKNAIAPDTLSYVQEVVFKQSWAGQLYPDIAKSVGYHPEYIRDVGAQLWRALSDSLGEKVTKKNVRYVLSTLADKQTAGSRESGASKQTDPSQTLTPQVNDVLRTEATPLQLSFPSVGLSVQSEFYVPRPPAEEQAFSELDRPGGLLRIKSPSNTGKTSLLLRALEYARSQGARTVLINMQEADLALLEDLSRFLRWFCRNVTHQLNLENKLDDYWDEEIGNKVSCKIYFREYLLNRIAEPLVIALDEVDQLFEHPVIVQEFLPMLRVWHEEAMELRVWQKLRLALAYNSEVYVPLKISQSPFNIGLSVTLPPLTLEQVELLGQKYGVSSDQASESLAQLHALVSGHPYLIQLALYWLSERQLSLSSLLTNAHTQASIYSAHLRRHWQILERQPLLRDAFENVLKNPEQGAQIDSLMAYQLERMGLVALSGNTAVVASPLYYRYFRDLLLA